eukprot:CAMPEP_0177749478 /NCGR_PEP_ID=MMETSP0484_2-20121128/32509_1 /TAXON_ID=354590 /ORGANISM="Rhodomonas lens, Strain RHODO" /LENGTH=40 /DNA_ID= /DNA_START= /DNA_END= /DNA_ORIENTATION=
MGLGKAAGKAAFGALILVPMAFVPIYGGISLYKGYPKLPL